MATVRRGDTDEFDPMQEIEKSVDEAAEPATSEEPADYDYDDPKSTKPLGPVHHQNVPLNYLDSEIKQPPTKSGDGPI